MRILLETYIYELIDRNVRFFMHLEKVRSEFYISTRAKDKIKFIDEYKTCLEKQFEILRSILDRIDEGVDEIKFDSLFKEIRNGFKFIGRLHTEGLHFLPRPSEPIELERFSRIINKQYIRWPEVLDVESRKISFFPTEDISETVFKISALEEYSDIINKYIDKYNKNFNQNVKPIDGSHSDDDALQITIPRIDSANPTRWPTLLHEMAHHIITDDFFRESMLSDFMKSYAADGEYYLDKVFCGDFEKLEGWLLECWCDLFASFMIGPSFYFSQYSAFLFAEPSVKSNTTEVNDYPPASFRLKLIFSIMQHRGKLLEDDELYAHVADSLKLYRYVDSLTSTSIYGIEERDFDGIYLLFKDYFLSVFFRDDGSSYKEQGLKDEVRKCFQSNEDIHLEYIKSMVKNVSCGYPISSIRINPESICERPARLQEILLAAWVYRQGDLRSKILGIAKDRGLNNLESHTNIVEIFNKYDQSILRSIQVSEWFKLFYDRIKGDNVLDDPEIDHLRKQRGGILVDHEIHDLIRARSLIVSPLISPKQIGTSSLDVRLGTSFQLFNRTGRGYIDFTDSESTHKFEENSKSIDLDFLESITIQPGQFVLGHTMEYFKIDEYHAAEIDGRSSFARMGIEIHMTAGFIDPGFEGVVTLEIFNAGSMPVILYPGMRIAQLRIVPVNFPSRAYNKKTEAKYKGFLTHNFSLQNRDPEVSCIKEAKKIYNA